MKGHIGVMQSTRAFLELLTQPALRNDPEMKNMRMTRCRVESNGMTQR